MAHDLTTMTGCVRIPVLAFLGTTEFFVARMVIGSWVLSHGSCFLAKGKKLCPRNSRLLPNLEQKGEQLFPSVFHINNKQNKYSTMTEESGNVFDALDAAANEEEEEVETPTKKVQVTRDPQVYRVPVTLYKDKETGEQFFYLQKGTFPNRSITKLNICYTEDEKAQVKEQVLADKTCPEILLKNVLVECHLNASAEGDDPSEYLNDESFRLSGSKIAAIRMRMYAKQKMEAQKQLEDPNCSKVSLRLDIECRLSSRTQEPKQ